MSPWRTTANRKGEIITVLQACLCVWQEGQVGL